VSKLVRFLLKLALVGLATPAFGATTQTYTGVIKDLTQQVVTSGQVTLTLTLPNASTIPGVGTFVPTTTLCNINVDGTLSGYVGGTVSGPCIVTANISLTPKGTAYRICEQPYYSTPGSCFFDYALGGTKDISSVVPSLSTGPTNYGGVQGPPIPFLGTWNSATTYVTAQVVVFSNILYISLQNPNLNNTPPSSPAFWSTMLAPASLLSAPSGTQTVIQPGSSTFNVSAGLSATANGVINPASCGWSTGVPAWCSGSDMGAWINAAIASLPGNGAGGSFGCGVVQLPYNSLYSFTTPIIKPRCTLIDLNQSSIGYMGGVSFPAVSVWDTFAVSEFTTGGIINGRIFGGTGFSAIVPGSIGIMMGGVITPQAGFCTQSSTTCYATLQTFDNLVEQNFTDGFRFGSNAFENNWHSVGIAGNTNGIHVIGANNSGENINFQAVYFGNNAAHDILVDTGAYAEFDIHGGSFDFSGGDSVVGPVHLSTSDVHVENDSPTWHFINCTGNCSINMKGGQILDEGVLNSTSSFGVFSGTGNQAIFDGVEWGIENGQVLSQFFVWNDSSPLSTLKLLNFRQAIFAGLSPNTALRYVPLYSGTAPPRFQSNPSQAAQAVPITGDVVIASGAFSVSGIYQIDFTETNFRSSMTVAVDASAGEAAYSLFVLENYGFDASSGTTFRNILNPRVVADSLGQPQLVVTLVNVVGEASPLLTAVRNGTPRWQPQILSGATVGTTSMGLRNGLLQDALGNISIAGTLSVPQLLPPTSSTAPTGSCSPAGTLEITADGHGTYCHASTLVWTTLY
jgi:hypothetical protein